MAVGDDYLQHFYGEPMTAPRIALQDGKLVLRDGKVGTGAGCCCDEEECCSLNADADAQPSVSVTDSGCPCEQGSLDGEYAFSGSFDLDPGRVWLWGGESGCTTDIPGLGQYANILNISVTCNAEGSNWVVAAGTYGIPGGGVFYSISGNASTCELTVDENGNLSGQVAVELYGDSDSNSVPELICTLDLAFG